MCRDCGGTDAMLPVQEVKQMASNAQQKKRTRRKKMTRQGKQRKRIVRARGTTPKFPIHPDKPGKKTVDVASLKIEEGE